MVKYVIGANDEPNGHGTVFVNWEKLNGLLEGHEQNFACKKLVAFLRLSNLYVGDAIANMLMCEAVLRDKGMTMSDFAKIYKENPSRMFKIQVPDRTIFKPVWDETRLEEPSELQDFIDQVNASVTEGKSFVRPSGTEDVLRLYAEAATKVELEQVAN